MKKTDPLERITEQILEHLKNGVVPWQPSHFCKTGLPKNFKTKQAYQGINCFSLASKRYASPWFLTYKQAQEMGGHVKKGEKGSLVIKVGEYYREGNTDEEKEKILYRKGYSVFNATQIDGIDFQTKPITPHLTVYEPCEQAEELIANYTQMPPVEHGKLSTPCYDMLSDQIHMPHKTHFKSSGGYFYDLFHEVVHSTGHKSRLDRKSLYDIKDARVGTATKAEALGLEELVAEMGSCLLSVETGIAEYVDPTHQNSAAYIDNWLEVLQSNDAQYWIAQASSQAQKAVNYVRENSGYAVQR